MFVRSKTTPRSKNTSIQLVESYRVDGKSKQRVVRHIGTAGSVQKLAELKRIAYSVKLELENQVMRQDALRREASVSKASLCAKTVEDGWVINVAYLEESARKVLGIHAVYGRVYELLNFTNVFSRPKQNGFSASILKDIVLARIAHPSSKRSAVAILEERFGKAINIDHVYQMMDKVDDAFCERIQKNALATTLGLVGEKLRVLFYDATTLYFESFYEDELKQNGYSKDMKFNQPQVVLTLFVTQQGLPVGYELFPGATFEGHTLIPILEKLKQRYQIEDVVFVADRGMLSEVNLSYLEKNKFHYIVGGRLKSLRKLDQKTILDWVGEIREIAPDDTDHTFRFTAKNGRQVLLSYRGSRAKKDRVDREKSIQKLHEKLLRSKNPKSLISNFGYQKFIKIEGKSTIAVDENKLANAAKWDGVVGVFTNCTESSDHEVWEHYHALWQIEESFRINKHDLRMRPIFHWKPDRVKAHIAICFMAFACVRYLEYRVATQYQKLSPEVIRNALLWVQASVIKDNKTGKQFLLPSKLPAEAKPIFRVLGMKPNQTVSEITT